MAREKDMDRANFSSFDFERIRKRGTVYVDKTMYIKRLLDLDSNVVVCTAPRRMGKSLFAFTLESLFLGKRELFKGLYIDGTGYDYEFHPVIHIDFAILGTFTSAGIDSFLSRELRRTARLCGLDMELAEPKDMIADLVDELWLKYDSAPVILIDEYDRPLNSCDETERLPEIQQALRRFYSVFKGLSPRLHLVYITGILKFSGLGIFSGLNNLVDISMDDRFAGMFGYSEEEVREYFHEGIEEYAEKEGMSEEGVYEALREMYDGYLLSPRGVRVYNPVSIGMFMYYLELENYWIRTGLSTIVVNYARKHQLSLDAIGDMSINLDSLATFSIIDFLSGGTLSDDKLLALLLMTGYLTFTGERNEEGRLCLRVPNKEVLRTLAYEWESVYVPPQVNLSDTIAYKIAKAMKAGDTATIIECLNHGLTFVTYDGFRLDERFFDSLFLSMLGISLESIPRGEEHTTRGRIDLFARSGSHAYIFETKIDRSAESAIRQIEEKGYSDKFIHWSRSNGITMHIVGLDISKDKRQIVEWKEKVE